jgi:dihydrofolate synthase/folylpolyglutamate synthase
VSRNKRVEEIVAQLVEIADLVICTRAYHYGSEVPVIAAIARKHRPDLEIHEARTIEQAMTLARALAVERGLTILVAGGLFLSIEAERAWKGLDPQALRFF